MMGFGFFWMLFFLALPLVLLYLLFASREGRAASPGSSGSAPRSAVDAARERYARGEIDRETYRRLIEDLEG